MAHREWSPSTSTDGAILPVGSTWREINKANSTSSWTALSKVDTDKNIAVNANGSTYKTVVVMMIFRTDGISGMNGGLVTTATNPSSYIGIATTGSYAVMDLDHEDSIACCSPGYGRVKAYSIHNLTSSSLHNTAYVTAEGASSHTSTRFFEVNYSSKGTTNQNRWLTFNKYNHSFYAITANYEPTYAWIGTKSNGASAPIAFNAGYTYRITVISNCAPNDYEGVVWFGSAKYADPGKTNTINNLGALNYVKGRSSMTFNYTPSSTENLYFYLRSTTHYTTNTLRTASIKIVKMVDITLYENRGTGGKNIQIAPFTAYSGALTSSLPTRAGVSGVNYTLKGFFASGNSSSAQYTDGSGILVDPDKTYRSTDDAYWYAVWGNTISYQPKSGTIRTYCTPNAEARTTTSNASISVADSPAKCASGESLSISYTESGTTIVSNGQYLKFADGKSAGSGVSYGNKNIYLSSPGSTTSGYESMSVSKKLPIIYLSTVALTSNVMSNTTITQHTDIPASGITINTISGVRDYYNVNPTQTLKYSNGASRAGTVSCVLSGSINVSSRGKIYDNSKKTNNISGVTVTMNGESSKTSTVNITTAIQQANTIQDVFVYTSPSANQITVFQSMELFASAKYTSGETRDLISDGVESTVSYALTLPSFMVSVNVS